MIHATERQRRRPTTVTRRSVPTIHDRIRHQDEPLAQPTSPYGRVVKQKLDTVCEHLSPVGTTTVGPTAIATSLMARL
jgi:hypothetical protein